MFASVDTFQSYPPPDHLEGLAFRLDGIARTLTIEEDAREKMKSGD
jgi:hypothetical protein